jgi:uncharacterized protein (TIGR03083 family)
VLSHAEVVDLLGAYALDACEPDEAAAIDAHVAGCAECAAEAARLRSAAGWLGALEVQPPPSSLRSAVLDVALARREPFRPLPSVLTLYTEVADALDELAQSLTPHDWDAVGTTYGWTCHQWVAHLLAGVSLVNRSLGITDVEDPAGGVLDWERRTDTVLATEAEASPVDTLARWRLHADALRRRLAAMSPADLDATIEFMGWAQPAGEAVTIHAFETWVHTDDIRRAIARSPEAPSTGSLGIMSDLAVHLLSVAMRAEGARHRARVVLTGAGGGEWTIPLGDAPAGDDAPVSVTVTAEVVDFCTLIGGRLDPHDLDRRVDGDDILAESLLQTAASFAFV